MSQFVKDGVDLMADATSRKAWVNEAIRNSPLCSGHESPVRYDRNRPLGCNELDTFVLYDRKNNTHMDAFGRCLSKEEVKKRSMLFSKRRLEAKEKKEATRAAINEMLRTKPGASPANKNGKEQA